MDPQAPCRHNCILRKVPVDTLLSDLGRIIPVAEIPSITPISALRSIVAATPIADNGGGDGDWNSQDWVGNALDRLVAAGYLDRNTRDRGIDRMIDAVLEAKDEKIL